MAQAQDDLTRQAEEALAELGYQPGPIDGLWDDTLSEAVNNYKRDRGLEPDSEISIRQFAALRAEAKNAAAAANGTITKPYEPPSDAPDVPVIARTEVRVPYHRIEDCRHRLGMGAMYYSEGRKEEIHLTDVCFDEPNGRFWSAESLENWTLSNDGPSFKEYKIIDQGVPDWQRHTLMLQPLPEVIAQMGLGVPGGGGTGAQWFWQVPRGYKPQAGPSRFAMGSGVLLDDPQDTEALDGTFYIAISMQHRVVGGKGKPPILPGMGFVGESVFDGTSGTGVLGPAPNGYLSDESTAKVSFTIADTLLGGNASLTGINGEKAGVEPTDWKSIELEVRELYGRADGEGGASIFLIGVGDGIATDQSGREFQLLTAIAVQGFRKE